MYDVIVIGAGPGGASTSYYLARQGAKVLLLDKSNFPRDKTCGDGLGPRAISVLGDMGLLERVSQKAWRGKPPGPPPPTWDKVLAPAPPPHASAEYVPVLAPPPRSLPTKR